MIITLKGTNTSEIGAKLVDLREEGGAVALGRVLTLVIVASGDDIEPAVEAANIASREHPCRVIVVDPGDGRKSAGLDAEIRIGGDAGASEVIMLRPTGPARREVDTLVIPLLLPDAPIVLWWPHDPPEDMAADPLGKMAQRRISDVDACTRPIESLRGLAKTYTPGDTDLSWARVTLWRGLVAAALDEPPYETVRSVQVLGNGSRPSTYLFAAWLAAALKVEVTIKHEAGASAITGITLDRRSGPITMRRPEGSAVVTLEQPGQPQLQIAMAMRPLADCLMEDLRRLDPDEIYELALVKGRPKVTTA